MDRVLTEYECNMDASCLCYLMRQYEVVHKAPGYACAGSVSGARVPHLLTFGCYMREDSLHVYWNFCYGRGSCNVNSAMGGGPCQSCPVGRFNDETSAMCRHIGKECLSG